MLCGGGAASGFDRCPGVEREIRLELKRIRLELKRRDGDDETRDMIWVLLASCCRY